MSQRIFFFLLGGVLSVTFNIAIVSILTEGLHWPDIVVKITGWPKYITPGLGWLFQYAYAVSLATVTLLAFLWSYHINFRTSSVWHACAPRYLCVVIGGYVINWWCAQALVEVFPDKEKVIIIIMMFSVACLKFLMYHFWVFPQTTSFVEKESKL
jgi:putative flippase GtrA